MPVCVRARVCFCTLMSCLFFAGDSPCSLAAVQDLFSPSLFITAKSIIEAVCPVLPPPPPLLIPLPFPVFPYPILHLPICVGAFKHDRVFCYVALLLYTNGILKWQVLNRLSQTPPIAESGRPDSRERRRVVRGMESCLKYPQGFSKGPGSAIRYTICLQDSTQLGSRVWWAENRDSQSQSSSYWPAYSDSAPTQQCDKVVENST